MGVFILTQVCCIINSMGSDLNELSKINLKPSTLEETLIIIAQMAEIIVKLDQIIVSLNEKITDLTEQLKLNSNNCSKPPSTDFKKKTKDKKAKSGKRRGAQYGHKGSFRALLPPEEVYQFVTCLPLEFCTCCIFLICRSIIINRRSPLILLLTKKHHFLK